MGAYWAAFARAGVPAAEGLPEWPVFAENGGSLMRFDSTNDGGVGVITEGDTLEKLAADLNADPRLADEERCFIAGIIRAWVNDVGNRIAEEIGCPN